MKSHLLFKLTDIPNQVRVLFGFHTGVSLFETNLAFNRVLITNFQVNSDFDIANSMLIVN